MSFTDSNCSVSYRVLDRDRLENRLPSFTVELRLQFIFQWVIFPSPEDNDDQQERSPSSEEPAVPAAAAAAPVVLQEVEGPTIIKTSHVNPFFLTSELVTEMVVHDMIFDLNLPTTILSRMKSNISALVCSMARQDFRRGNAVSPVSVEVQLKTSFPYDDEDGEGDGDADGGDGDGDDDDDDQVDGVGEEEEEEEMPTEGIGMDEAEEVSFRAVPAERSAIESLGKIVFDGQENGMCCSICLGEFVIGSELSCMPCSHAFHEQCIVQWLGRSNLCPLCRFRMPT